MSTKTPLALAMEYADKKSGQDWEPLVAAYAAGLKAGAEMGWHRSFAEATLRLERIGRDREPIPILTKGDFTSWWEGLSIEPNLPDDTSIAK